MHKISLMIMLVFKTNLSLLFVHVAFTRIRISKIKMKTAKCELFTILEVNIRNYCNCSVWTSFFNFSINMMYSYAINSDAHFCICLHEKFVFTHPQLQNERSCERTKKRIFVRVGFEVEKGVPSHWNGNGFFHFCVTKLQSMKTVMVVCSYFIIHGISF